MPTDGHRPFSRPEQFQEKCVAVFPMELRKNKKIEPFRDSKKHGKALTKENDDG